MSLFADDLKMYIKVNSIQDCERLQLDLLNFSNLCIINRLKINIDKCAFIISPVYHRLFFNYFINSHVIESISFIKDLSIILSANISFDEHISFIDLKSIRMLGFL